jgi:DNA-directed RNA polymerase subunit alpha
VQYFDLGSEQISVEASAAASVDDDLIRKLNMPINELDLTVRAGNCLNSAKVRYVADLVSKDEPDLLAVRSFGKTSLREVKRKLEEMGLSLGMKLPEGYQAPSMA